jgi:hypothetical protein
LTGQRGYVNDFWLVLDLVEKKIKATDMGVKKYGTFLQDRLKMISSGAN